MVQLNHVYLINSNQFLWGINKNQICYMCIYTLQYRWKKHYKTTIEKKLVPLLLHALNLSIGRYVGTNYGIHLSDKNEILKELNKL